MTPAATAPVTLDIAYHFANVPDPRHRAFRKHHLLSDILVVVLSAVLSGSRSWESIAAFGVAKEPWLRDIGLTLPNGLPSHDTYYRVFAALDPLAFQHAFTGWINAVCGTLEFVHIPIDGKTLRGSREADGTCLHLVTAWAAEHRLTLAQVAVEDKSNEITAIPEILRMLDLHGALVSIDAMGCQKAIARDIRDGGGDYLFALKDNQPDLYADVMNVVDEAIRTDLEHVEHDTFVTRETSHGRTEERVYTVLYGPTGLSTADQWLDLKSIVHVLRIRRDGDRASMESAYYISSSTAPAAVLAQGIRAHWSIENGQHWCLDVLFGEDHNRTHDRNAAENMAWLRRMALCVLRNDDSQGTVPTKQMRAACDDDYRFHLLHLLNEKYE